ncbi:MAG: hydratase, partial [Firmicutes bacterium]|nr:hydratase [Bacillota bacterium]
MITCIAEGVYVKEGKLLSGEEASGLALPAKALARQGTIAASILAAHHRGGEDGLRIAFDSLISHDITYVGILQTARASGMTVFPVPYVMTNCHNSLCAVGGTINEDDHLFGLSAARRYGGIYVPANLAVIHQYAREAMAQCGHMILGSDSHTRYGSLGAMGIGEGGPELVKQLLSARYDLPEPDVVLVYLEGTPRRGVGPHDVALALCKAVYASGFVKNKVLEFVGPGIRALPMDFRLGLDVMTTETACLSSIWETDETVEAFYHRHGRPEKYRRLAPGGVAYYDAAIRVDLSKAEPMIALPFHPSNAYPLREMIANAGDLLRDVEREANALFGQSLLRLAGKAKDGRVLVDQGVIAGCAGGLYDNISEAAAILAGGSTGSGRFSLSVYPASVPVQLDLMKNGSLRQLMEAGAVIKPCFCGPCFGAGDVPGHGSLSVRHTTRNFPNREGSKPGEGQLAAVALMDARSIAATARNGGRLTPATDIEYALPNPPDGLWEGEVYAKRVYNGFGHPLPGEPLVYGPGIADWPAIPPL